VNIDDSIMDEAADFLVQGGELDAARTLQACTFVTWDYNDSWTDGSRRLDGVDIELAAPRTVYETITDSNHPVTAAIRKAISAVLPGDTYLKSIRVRAASATKIAAAVPEARIGAASRSRLIELLEAQKSLMIAVSTGGPRIDSVNQDYQNRQIEIRGILDSIQVRDPNPFPDLWAWYGKWSDGSLPNYHSRRQYIGEMFQPLVDSLRKVKVSVVEPAEPTGWTRVDRNVEKITASLESARNEEDFQALALHCREALISLAQAVFIPDKHPIPDGIFASSTDSKRMLDAFISVEAPGESNDYVRKHAKAAVDLAVNLQHKRTASFRDAALCAEATRSVINTIAILSGRAGPVAGES
jgi:hypothetical protein